MSDDQDTPQEIGELQKRLKELQIEVKMLQGRVANNSPELVRSLTQENSQLKERIGRMEKALLTLLVDASTPKQLEDSKTKIEVLRKSAVEYFQRTNINAEIWKNIVS
jgi:hypothetical protein